MVPTGLVMTAEDLRAAFRPPSRYVPAPSLVCVENTHNGAGGVTKFKGTLVSSKPELRPKEITLAIEKPGVADCVLKLAEGATLPGKMEPGGTIEFDGTAKEFTKEPFMLTFEVTKEQIVGWTGKNAPARPTPKKKAQ